MFAFASPASAVPAATQFVYAGGEQSYSVPSGVTLLLVDALGADGGGGIPAAGMNLEGYLPTTPGQTLYVEVGQVGSLDGGVGFGGGGAAGADPPLVCMSGGIPCSGVGSGGGASDVRTCSELAASCPGGVTSVASRLLVAGGGGGSDGDGSNADQGAVEASAGGGYNLQNPLPAGNSGAGPVPILTAAGIVIPGEPNQAPYFPFVTPAEGGTTTGGAGGTDISGGGGSFVTFDGVAGSSGSGAVGGPGGDASGFTPCCTGNELDSGAGGGGGGYAGGGGGSTGPSGCGGDTGMLCSLSWNGQGGGGGSSFVANEILYPSVVDSPASPSITFTPVIQIESRADGAVYNPGQVVDAGWSCSSAASSCNGTVASGLPIDTSPGTHTFTVTANFSGNQPAASSVTYTVAAANCRSTRRPAGKRSTRRPRACPAPRRVICWSRVRPAARGRAAGRPARCRRRFDLHAHRA
ncbi:MAG: hypothetical protein ACLP01_13870 [Solirubrobacteraceae bacterium]